MGTDLKEKKREALMMTHTYRPGEMGTLGTCSVLLMVAMCYLPP